MPAESLAPDPDHAPRRRRRGRRIVAFVLGLALVAVAGMAGFVLYLNQILSNLTVDHSLLPSASSETTATGPTGAPIDESPTQPLRGPGTNYLIIGSDARPGERIGRSDVIILSHITEARDKVYLIHFPRDLYVDIPGHGKDKINAAYAYGGGALLVETIQNLTGVTIEHAAAINFHGFKRMTDTVGGVRVYAEEPSTSGGVVITKGWNDLNGTEALAFVRERKELSEGDISRGLRQLAFVRALMVKALRPSTFLNPVKMSRLTDALIDNAVFDSTVTAGYLRSQALSLREVRGDDVVFITAPWAGYGTAPDGGAIDLLDEARMELLALALQDDNVEEFLETK